MERPQGADRGRVRNGSESDAAASNRLPERSRLSFELGSDLDGGAVGPGAVERFLEDFERILAGFGGDVGVVGVAASGEADVDRCAVKGAVDEEEAVVDGSALGGVDGLGVGELEVFVDVVPREGGPAVSAGDGADFCLPTAFDSAGAMMAFFTLRELHSGQTSLPSFSCSSNADEEENQPSNSCPFAQLRL